VFSLLVSSPSPPLSSRPLPVVSSAPQRRRRSPPAKRRRGCPISTTCSRPSDLARMPQITYPSGCKAGAPWAHGPRSTAGPRPHQHHVVSRQPPRPIASCHESHSQQLRTVSVPFLQSGPCKTMYFYHLFSVSCTLIKTTAVESCFYTLVPDDVMLTSSQEKFAKISFYIS
jgi:hypothetical protein